jgi:hypothetical protein
MLAFNMHYQVTTINQIPFRSLIVKKKMATHQVSASQSKTKQSRARTKAAPQRPKTKDHPNLTGKLVSHRSHRLLALESNKKTEAATNTHPPTEN